MKNIKVVIAGSRGYTGQVLLDLVTQHPNLSLVGLLANPNSDYQHNTYPNLSLDDIQQASNAIDVLLLATPAAVSIDIATSLQHTAIALIDLSGAFRLPQADLNQWYQLSHDLPLLTNGAPYGLSPWQILPSSLPKLIANPGCYATCALMSLIPLLKDKMIQPTNIIIDAKSGVSGAGKQPQSSLMFSEMHHNFFPYKISTHQHLPEIKQALSLYTKQTCQLHFTTQMLPLFSGIAMSIYADARHSDEPDDKLAIAIENTFNTAYKHYPFVKLNRIMAAQAEKHNAMLSLKHVIGTPFTHINYYVNQGKVIVFAFIDNLMKGAASQAIENVNCLFDLPIDTGLRAGYCG